MSSAVDKKPLTVFKLVMISVVAIDSLKNLPFNAQYGANLLIFYTLAVVLFFIPSAMVSAELASNFPQMGGVYIWVKEAFGKRIGFLTVWIQWLIAITWYPTILSFIVVQLSELFSPMIFHHDFITWAAMVGLFWVAIFFICRGMKTSSKISTFCALLGVIIPMLFIIVLGIYWLALGQPIKMHVTESLGQSLFTDNHGRLFITLLYSLMGMEMIATHAGDVQNPKKNYPLAIAITGVIILFTVVPASLSLALVIPADEIHLAKGVLDAFLIFLNSFHLTWLKPFVILAITVGSFGIFYNWLLTSSRGLLVAAVDNHLPKCLTATNSENIPQTQLLLQGALFTLLSTLFIFLPSFNAVYWLLSAACAELALFYYLFIFSAAFYLQLQNKRCQKISLRLCNVSSFNLCCLVGFSTCLLSIVFGFIPTDDMSATVTFYFEVFLVSILVGSVISGMMICKIAAHKI